MEVKRYLVLLWRWSWLILLGALIAGGAAYLVNKNTMPVYRASARFLIDQAPGSTGGNDYSKLLLEQRLAQTYVELMKTTPVLQETIERLELPLTVNQLAGRIAVNAPQDTQIINVHVEDTDPLRAALIANTLGEVFIEHNQARENLRYAEPIATWERRIREVGDEIEALDTQINAAGTAETAEAQAALSRLETQRNEARIRYTDAFNKLNDLQFAQLQESSNLALIEPAQPRFSPIRPRTTSNTLVAAATGVIAALALVFLIEYLDDTVKSPEQILEDTGLSTLGAIAVIKGEALTERLVTQNKPRDPISEAYRVLRTNLSFSAVDGGLHTFLVTSSSPGEGKSTTVANLAVVMAQTGKRVIVADADLRRPLQHKLFALPNNYGLTTAILDSETPVSQHLQSTKMAGLSILTSGPIPPNPAELLNSQRMSQVLAELKQEADLVIFDTPPALTVADASILASQVNGCVLVVEAAATRRDALQQAAERLQNTGATLFGAVINRLKPGRGGYYDYYYYYYQNYATYEQGKKGRFMGRGQRRFANWFAGLTRQ
jgi:capsular exopolysaccharide synthesis family protein